jgi:hypothetical protein
MSKPLPIQAFTSSYPTAEPGQSARLPALPGFMIAPTAWLAGRQASKRRLPSPPGIPHG